MSNKRDLTTTGVIERKGEDNGTEEGGSGLGTEVGPVLSIVSGEGSKKAVEEEVGKKKRGSYKPRRTEEPGPCLDIPKPPEISLFNVGVIEEMNKAMEQTMKMVKLLAESVRTIKPLMASLTQFEKWAGTMPGEGKEEQSEQVRPDPLVNKSWVLPVEYGLAGVIQGQFLPVLMASHGTIDQEKTEYVEMFNRVPVTAKLVFTDGYSIFYRLDSPDAVAGRLFVPLADVETVSVLLSSPPPPIQPLRAV